MVGYLLGVVSLYLQVLQHKIHDQYNLKHVLGSVRLSLFSALTPLLLNSLSAFCLSLATLSRFHSTQHNITLLLFVLVLTLVVLFVSLAAAFKGLTIGVLPILGAFIQLCIYCILLSSVE